MGTDGSMICLPHPYWMEQITNTEPFMCAGSHARNYILIYLNPHCDLMWLLCYHFFAQAERSEHLSKSTLVSFRPRSGVRESMRPSVLLHNLGAFIIAQLCCIDVLCCASRNNPIQSHSIPIVTLR